MTWGKAVCLTIFQHSIHTTLQDRDGTGCVPPQATTSPEAAEPHLSSYSERCRSQKNKYGHTHSSVLPTDVPGILASFIGSTDWQCSLMKGGHFLLSAKLSSCYRTVFFLCNPCHSPRMKWLLQENWLHKRNRGTKFCPPEPLSIFMQSSHAPLHLLSSNFHFHHSCPSSLLAANQ